MPSIDLAVIGAGEAGIAAALQAADLGASVCLVEKSRQLGGACVATGTLPSKTFSISASMLELAGKMKNFGIRLGGPVTLDFSEVQASRLRITRCDQGILQSHLRSHRVQLVQGQASFQAKDRLLVREPRGAQVEVAAPRIIVAVGSRPAELPGLPADGQTILTTDDIVDRRELPGQVLIVGAGVIGCEYAFIFRSFGVKVVLVEKLGRALLGQDKDVISLIEKELTRKGVRFLPGTTLTECRRTPEGRVQAETDRGEQLRGDFVLICAGRTPWTEDLNLEGAGVRTGLRGEVTVDARLQTSAPGIYAAGDVIGRRMLSSTAILEGALAAENALGGNRELDERVVPNGIYTQPEIGAVGLTEDEALSRGQPVLIGRCSYAGLVKACSLYSATSGFIKMIFEPGSFRLLGGHIVGSEAAEIIHQLALALKLGATAADFIYSVYHHPSISEGFRQAARDALKKSGRA